MMKSVLIILIATSCMCAGCGSRNEEEQVVRSIGKSDYDKFRLENQKLLDDLSAGIVQAMLKADTADITDTFLLDTKHLGFSPVMGTHTNEGEADPDFNAIWVGSYAHGMPMPDGMKEDYFRSSCYLNLIHVKEGRTAEEYGLGDSDSRAFSTGYAFVQAMKQLRYVVVVHPLQFSAGNLYVSSKTFEPAQFEGVIMIYDLQEKKMCGAKTVKTSGPESISYSFDAPSNGNGYSDKEDQAAVYEFEKENREALFRNTMITLGTLANAAEFTN